MVIGELVDRFQAWCGRHRSPATCEFYRCRLRLFRERFRDRELATLTPLEIDDYLAEAGAGLECHFRCPPR